MTQMPFGTAARLAIAGVVLLVLAFIFTGLLSRPLIVAGAVCLVQAALDARRDTRRQIRVFTDQRRAVAALIAVLIVGLLGFWAVLPSVQRFKVLGQLATFCTEGQQIKADLAQRVGPSNQLMGDYTARIKDWDLRVQTWVSTELGPFYKQRLGTPRQGTMDAYPPNMPLRLQVFWDIVETDLGAMEQFRTEFSRWLF